MAKFGSGKLIRPVSNEFWAKDNAVLTQSTPPQEPTSGARRRPCPLAGLRGFADCQELLGFWRWTGWGLLLLTLAITTFVACGGSQSLEFQAEKPIDRVIPATETEMIDLRFKTGSIRINPSDTKEVRIEGKIYVSTTDQATAMLKSEEADLDVTPPGRFMIIQMPEDGEGVEYEVELDIAVPKDVDLRVVLEAGDIETNLELPNRTDMQVASGEVRINLPKDFSAQINAKSNAGAVTVEGFDTMTGDVRRQLIYSEFNGAVGAEWLGGRKIELSVNSGPILIQGADLASE